MKLSFFKLDHKTTFLTPLFLNESGRSIAVSLLSFFSTIYIYKKILDLTADKILAFILAFAFFAILQVFKIIGTFLAENLALKIGLKKQVVLGNLLTMATLLAFSFSEKNLIFLVFASVFWGLSIGFYWFGYYGLLTKIGHDGRFGEALGWAGILSSLFVAGVPFLGGFLISRFGYAALFLVALVFLFLGLAPLFSLPDQKTHRDILFQEILKLIFSHKRMALVYFSFGACGEIYSLALILYIFLFVGEEFSFGKFFSLSLLLVAMVNFWVGKWTDKKGKRGLVYYGAFFSSLVWFGRFLAGSVSSLFIFDVIDRVSGGMIGIPMTVLTFEKAVDGHSTGRALVFRETAVTIGAILADLLLMAIVFFGLSFKFAFLVAGVLMLAPFLITKDGFS